MMGNQWQFGSRSSMWDNVGHRAPTTLLGKSPGGILANPLSFDLVGVSESLRSLFLFSPSVMQASGISNRMEQ